MIELAIKTLEPLLIDLPYIDKYGGLAFTARQYDEIYEGTSYRRVKASYPVQSTVSQIECWNGGKYRELSPNSMNTSIVYWRVVREMQQVPSGKGNRIKTFQGSAELVFWFNLAKAGKTAASGENDFGRFTIRPEFELAVTKILQEDVKVQVINANFPGSSVRVGRSTIKRNDLSLFSDYTYGQDVEQFLMYPNDFGAIEFELFLDIPAKCVANFELGADLGCITNQ
jgi:hypothetical protein